MKAVAVVPEKLDSLHLAELPTPKLSQIGGGRGVLVRILQVGLDGTDREILDGHYGAAPPGYDFLVLGHEALGVVTQVGSSVTELNVGDYVVPMVRRPGDSPYDAIGLSDMTTDDTYYEHGISLLHGYLTEQLVESPEFLIPVPAPLRDVGVWLEPMSVVAKGLSQAYEIQRRLRIWRPRRAAVLGAGPLGLLATLALRLRDVEVVTMARTEPPYLNSQMAEMVGARYVSTRQMPLPEVAAEFGPFDLIFEAAGYSPLVFEAMEVLAKNGVLVVTGTTMGDREATVATDAINRGFVLGNKVMVGTVNASRDDFNTALRDLAHSEARYSGWLGRLITHRVAGLENYAQAFAMMDADPKPIKVVVEVAGKG